MQTARWENCRIQMTVQILTSDNSGIFRKELGIGSGHLYKIVMTGIAR